MVSTSNGGLECSIASSGCVRLGEVCKANGEELSKGSSSVEGLERLNSGTTCSTYCNRDIVAFEGDGKVGMLKAELRSLCLDTLLTIGETDS